MASRTSQLRKVKSAPIHASSLTMVKPQPLATTPLRLRTRLNSPLAGRALQNRLIKEEEDTMPKSEEKKDPNGKGDKEDEDYNMHTAEAHEIVSKIESCLVDRAHEHPVFSQSPSILHLPSNFVGINRFACEPELVSIGPYHKDKDHLQEWEQHKLYFLNNYKLRSQKEDLLKGLVLRLGEVEQAARECYTRVTMSRKDFIEMMLVDGCFVVELLYHLDHREGEIDVADPIFTRPSLIPILLRDLLKLENQLPYFVLQFLFDSDLYPWEQTGQPFCLLALQVFNQVYRRPLQILETIDDRGTEHLLDLFHSSLNPLTKATDIAIAEQVNDSVKCRYLNITSLPYFLNSLIGERLSKRKSYGTIQSVSNLIQLGIKFKFKETINFLDLKFEKNVMEIPSITINEFTSTLLINCVAWARARENESKSKYVTDYVFFMGCLLNQPRDAAFLCSKGIISRHSQSDKNVSDMFHSFGTEVGYISRDSHLSQLLTKFHWYCNSPLATFYLKFISDPLSSLPIYALLILILTLAQTIMAILSLQKDRS